jgi:hypothetical protein
MRLHSPTPLASHFRKPAIVLALLSATALLTIAAPAQSWQNKDWTQWQMVDCKFVLHDSPWAVAGGAAAQNDILDPGRGPGTPPVAQMSSSLVIRQALVRQAQLAEHFDKMSPQKQKAFDQKATACLGNIYDDRFVIHIIYGQLLGPFPLSVDGRQIHTHGLSHTSISPCIDNAGTSLAFPRVIDGRPVVPPGAKILKVGDFTFNLEKMIYKGQLDF